MRKLDISIDIGMHSPTGAWERGRIDTMVHLGARAFEEIGGEVVQSVAFVLEKAD